MLTPTGREVAETAAYKVPAGAVIYGGARDGLVVHRTVTDGSTVVLVCVDGSEIRSDIATHVAWLHPAGRRTTAC